MKRLRAFTLTEILTGTMLQAGFVLVLMGAFYMLVNFQAASTKLITAREKGQRVLAYIENRVIHAGLGLHKCKSSNEIRNSFDDELKKQDTVHGSKAFYGITLPVAVTCSSTTSSPSNWKTMNTEKDDEDNRIYIGNILTVLYAMPYPGLSDVLVLDNDNSGAVKTISGDVTCKFLGLYSKISKLSDLEDYAVNDPDNLRSYKVTASSGVPLYISDFNSSKKTFNLTTKFKGESIDIASGAELFTLQCEKLFVYGGNTDRNFSFVRLDDNNNWYVANDDNFRYETGILDIYFELNTATNTLDCYVLASGGQDPSLDNPIPASWPDNKATKSFRDAWNNNGYNHHEVYVSRASWKLHNVPSSFTW